MTEPEALRVATYNVHGWIGADGRHDPYRVASVIRELDADAVGLQEVDAGYRTPFGADLLRWLEQVTGLHAVAGPTLDAERGQFGNVALTRLPPRDVRRLDLTVARREPRGALALDLDAGGPRFVVTHFGLQGRERREQVDRLARELESETDGGLVVVGDVNEWRRGGSVLRRLDGLLGRSPAVRSFPARRPLLALDRIWARPADRLLDVRAHRSPRARVASDHLPVVASVRPVSPPR